MRAKCADLLYRVVRPHRRGFNPGAKPAGLPLALLELTGGICAHLGQGFRLIGPAVRPDNQDLQSMEKSMGLSYDIIRPNR